MGIQFRKRKKIAPGLTLNIGKRGMGVRVGPKHAGISFSPTGTRVGASIPGSGLSASKKVSSKGTPHGWGLWLAAGIGVLVVALLLFAR